MEPPPLPPTTPSRDDDDGLGLFRDDPQFSPAAQVAGPQRHSTQAPSGASLSEDDFALVREATIRRKAIRKAAKVAKGSATTTLIIGALAVPFVLLSFSLSGLMITAGLLVVGTIERRGHRMLLAADPAAPKLLARNQLAFLGLITIYCIWQILTAGAVEAVSPEFRAQLGSLPSYENMVNDIERLWPLVLRGIYALVIVLSIAFQGTLAYYYHSRSRHIQAYLSETPDWVKRMMDETQA